MSSIDVISLLASIASLVLAVVAIWLSIVFYRMSTAASGATTEAAKGIAASVDRLEKLFDKLYADTFSMMRDTVTDMRKHIWPAEDPEAASAAEEMERKADAKVDDLKRSMETQLSEMFQRQQMAGDQVTALRQEMRHLLERAIVGSRQLETEAREETLRTLLMREIRLMRRHQTVVRVGDIVERLGSSFPTGRVLRELSRLANDGLLIMSTSDLAPDTEVSLAIPSSVSPKSS